MIKPEKPVLAECGVHNGETSSFQQFFVGERLFPTYSANTMEAPLVGGVVFLLLCI